MTNHTPPPNIIIVIADEMRGDCISIGGKVNSVIKTPNIDKLSKDGVAFTNCFTVNPYCVPSRCCTFTGQYVHSSGHRGMYQMLEAHEENLFKFLKDNGYEVMWAGRNDLFTKQAIKNSVSKHFSLYSGARDLKKIASGRMENPFPTNHRLRKSFYYGKRGDETVKDEDFYIIEATLEYLNSNLNKPFFLYVALADPHPPYSVEEPYFSMYDRKEVPVPIPAILEDKPEFMKLIHIRYGLDKLTEEDFRELVATYYGMISRVDNHFGLLLEKLKEIGEYDNSAIFFLADHGDYVGDYGLTEKWPTAFQDCLVKVPFIAKIPNLSPISNINSNLMQTIDLFPTILEIAGIKTQYTSFGRSLLPAIEDNKHILREAVFSEGGYNPREPQCFEGAFKNPNDPYMGIYFEKTNIPLEFNSSVTRGTMIRTREWKLVIRSDAKEELYDLINDPKERKNLINNKAYIQQILELKEGLLRWYLDTSDNPSWKRLRLS